MRLVRISISTVFAIVVLLALSGGGASAATPCPPGQPFGREPGSPHGTPGAKRPQYPIGQCQLSLSAKSARAGSTVTASGNGYQPGSSVAMSVGDRPVGTATADSNGSFTQAFTVPAELAPGSYAVVASSGGHEQAAELQVVAADGSTAGVPAKAGQPASSGLKSGSGLAAPADVAQKPGAAGGQVVDGVSGEVAAGLPNASAKADLASAASAGPSPWIFGAGALGLLGVGATAVLATKRKPQAD